MRLYDRALYRGMYLYHFPDYWRAKRTGLKLDWTDLHGVITEWGVWSGVYIPDGGLYGKTVLDVGACCGGTPYLFFMNGAKKVVAIERDPVRVEMLKENRSKFGWDMEIIGRSFEVSDLDIKRDFTKVDIEGYEMLLLDYPDKLGLMSLESHTWYTTDRFRMIGFRPLTQPMEMGGSCVMANWA